MDLNLLLQSRRTIRKFRREKLTKKQLETYVNAARLAPSAANLQPLRFVAVTDEKMTEKLFPLVKWAGYLAPNYTPQEGERPVAYIAVCTDCSVRAAGYETDAGAAVENLILSALADGVGACWMGAIDVPKITELLDIREPLKLLYVVALGYPAETPQETEMKANHVEYYLDAEGTLQVPKRTLDEVLIKII